MKTIRKKGKSLLFYLLVPVAATITTGYTLAQDPTFSRHVESLFPSRNFRTCLQFESGDTSAWSFKAHQSGNLSVIFSAVSVNPQEGGSLIARITKTGSGTLNLGQVEVNYPTGRGVNPGAENTGVLNIQVTEETIYQIEVTHTGLARHFALGFAYDPSFSGGAVPSGAAVLAGSVPITLGVESPTFYWEEIRQVFHFNIHEGEVFQLTVLVDGPEQSPQETPVEPLQGWEQCLTKPRRSRLRSSPLFQATVCYR